MLSGLLGVLIERMRGVGVNVERPHRPLLQLAQRTRHQSSPLLVPQRQAGLCVAVNLSYGTLAEQR